MNEFQRAEIAVHEILQEYNRAIQHNGEFNSAHEGFAVIHEEFDELKAEVWKNEQIRDYDAMMKEAVQIGAMAMRFIVDVCLKKQEDKPRSELRLKGAQEALADVMSENRENV